MSGTKRKFAVVLSGCGVNDGSEIHEATMTLLAIHRVDAEYEVFAPDMMQYHVINHLTGEEMNESRNVLVESARIARGKIKPLKSFRAESFDGLIFPGGFGAAKNLSTFAFEGEQMTVHPDVEKAVLSMHQAGKPIGALCISPVILAKVLAGVKVTIGQDPATATAIQSLGGIHKATNHREVVIDKANKIVTNPCYMLDANLVDIAEGAENTVRSMIELM
ncbi:MAG: isoprenoid biosynthesis glyoxalase ElbB [Bacteroidales bacterium]|nr:isoprenoid biosynthesis glyoxalase ElbB [Bacteroidales bacterium]